MSPKHQQLEPLDQSRLPSLPPGWCWTLLETVADIDGGITKDQKRRHEGRAREVPYLRVANVQRGYLDLAEVKTIIASEEEVQALRLRPGDILFTEGGDRDKLGRGWVWSGEIDECIHQNHIFRARPCLDAVEPKFVSLHGNFFGQQWFTRTGKQTTNLASINKSVLRAFPVPVAPLDEQRRIVAKVEELFSDLDAGVHALERVRAKLKRYRAAVLKAAISGKLTAAWRALHPASQPATALLDSILSERRRRWEEAHRAKFGGAATEPKNWQTKYQQPAGPDTSRLPALPEGWCWATVAQLLAEPACNGISVKGTDEPPGIPALRLSAMGEAGFDYSERRYIPIPDTLAEHLAVREGDFFVARGNGSLSLVGRGTIAQAPPGIIVFPDTMIRLRFVPFARIAYFISLVWQSTLLRSQVEKKARTTAGIYKISQRDIDDFVVPVPPLSEQEEIIEVLSERLTIVDQLQTQVEANLKRAARLRQSILKRAFEGRLVPQVETDEPATVLLERIRQRRAETAATEATGEARKPGKRRREPNEVFFKRVAVVTYIVCRMADDPSFGRTKLEKILHLTQTHLPYPLGLEFKRYAAGPFDEVIYKDEAVAKKRGWFETKDRPSFGVTYHSGPNADDLCRRATDYLADKQQALDRLLDQLRGLTTDDAELLATLYAAWNDLLIDGRPTDEEALVAEVYGWDESKRRFSRADILNRIAWMRQHGYVPTGGGRRTTVLKKKVKLPSSRKKPSR